MNILLNKNLCTRFKDQIRRSFVKVNSYHSYTQRFVDNRIIMQSGITKLGSLGHKYVANQNYINNILLVRNFSTQFNKYKVIEVHTNKMKNNSSKSYDLKPFTVSLVGRTNVGKSALFNRLTARRDAIVCKEMNTTRDRREGHGKISGLEFNLIDTGGVWMNTKQGTLEESINIQTQNALIESDVVLFVLDIHDGITPQDKEISRWLRSFLKYKSFHVQVVLNKCEGRYNPTSDIYNQLSKDIYSLGFGSPIGISAEHGEGLLDIFDVLRPFSIKTADEQINKDFSALSESENSIEMSKSIQDMPVTNDTSVSIIPPFNEQEILEEDKKTEIKTIDIITREPIVDTECLRLCVIGRPNSGKSTLLNTLIGENRFITGNMPGLTRDSISYDVNYKNRTIELIDTAGIKRNSFKGEKTANSLSIWNTYKSISLSHIVCLLLDGEKQLTREEIAFANKAIDEGKGLFICLNKCDLFQDLPAVKKALIEYIYKYLPQIGKPPTLLISAKNNIGLNTYYDISIDLFNKWRTRLSTSILNRWLRDALERQKPPRVNGKQIKLKYMTQIKTRPPTFVIFANREGVSDNYIRYLESGLRKDFGLHGIPLRIYIRVPENNKYEPNRKK